jgi:hypothetical protein
MLRLIVLVGLYDLPEVHLSAEYLLNGVNVGSQRIGGNLDSVSHPACHIPHESLGSRKVTLPTLERGHQFGFCINRAERPNVAILRAIVWANMPLFFADKAPNFVKLQATAWEIAHLRI